MAQNIKRGKQVQENLRTLQMLPSCVRSFFKTFVLRKNSLIMATARKHVKIEYVESDNEDAGSSSDPKKIKFTPKNWEIVFENIREMRKTRDAPVDTMGCAQCADKNANIKIQRFQILVALMLSSQTKDSITFAACQRLNKFGFTAKELAGADVNELEDLIKPVGFYKTKAKHIKKSSQMILDDFKGEVVGIGVDVHVHRIANRLNWTSTKNPEQTEAELESWLPRKDWREVNLLLVGFGQQICTPKSPHCGDCLNSLNDLCPSAFKDEKRKK